jgi:putative SOS response-associated peptidase YedK
MCGRYFFERSEENKAVTDIIDWIIKAQPKEAALMKTGEIFPTNTVPVIADDGQGNAVPRLMKWGYTHPAGKGTIINTRSETALEKPMFRQSARMRRCLVPALHYYEWEKRDGNRVKYAIRPKGRMLSYFAGLYRMEKDVALPVFTILTADASEGVSFIHDRMPVILPEEVQLSWLSLREEGFLTIAQAQRDMEYRTA